MNDPLDCTLDISLIPKKNSKLELLNVAPVRLLNFSLFIKKMENWDFEILA